MFELRPRTIRMALQWKSRQRQDVERILKNHPRDSGKCEEAAKKILPIALDHDPNARTLKIAPKGRGRFVLPKVKLDKPWYYHFTTEVSLHYVDALTGADGTE